MAQKTPSEIHNPIRIFKDVPDAELIAFTSKLQQGNMSLSYGSNKGVLANRKRFLGELGIDYAKIVAAIQVHGERVKRVGARHRGSGALAYQSGIKDTDVLVTGERKVCLAIFTADCLPVFLHDPVTCTIGLVHAGWRSTVSRIVMKTLELMRKDFGCRMRDMIAGLGPAILDCCYEVGPEMSKQLPFELIRKQGRLYLDLAGANRKQLLAAGLQNANIFASKRCTCCSEDFFSYRRQGPSTGRMMSVMMLP